MDSVMAAVLAEACTHNIAVVWVTTTAKITYNSSDTLDYTGPLRAAMPSSITQGLAFRCHRLGMPSILVAGRLTVTPAAAALSSWLVPPAL